MCAQQRTCQKVDEDFSKQMWSSRIIQTLPLQFPNVILIFRSPLSRRTAISHEKGKRFFEYYCGRTYKVVGKNSM